MYSINKSSPAEKEVKYLCFCLLFSALSKNGIKANRLMITVRARQHSRLMLLKEKLGSLLLKKELCNTDSDEKGRIVENHGNKLQL